MSVKTANQAAGGFVADQNMGARCIKLIRIATLARCMNKRRAAQVLARGDIGSGLGAPGLVMSKRKLHLQGTGVVTWWIWLRLACRHDRQKWEIARAKGLKIGR